MSKYGTGSLGNTISKIQRRKQRMKEAMGAARAVKAPAKGAKKATPAVKNKNVKGKAMPRTSPNKAAAQKSALQAKIAKRVAAGKKKTKARTLRGAMR